MLFLKRGDANSGIDLSLCDRGGAHNLVDVVFNLHRSRTGQQRRHLAALPVKALDATGAGDCFGGNLIARVALGDTLPQAVRYANAAAALAVQGYGAVAPLPRPEAVYRLLG